MNYLIAGAGERGQKLAKTLKKYGVEKINFLDNNSIKWGTKIDDIEVFPINHFKDKECVVFVSPSESEEMEAQLKKSYKNVFGKTFVDAIIYSPYNVGYENFFPLGHFYSLYPDANEILSQPDYPNIDKKVEITGINLNENIQKEYLGKMVALYGILPEWKSISGGGESKYRYRLGNPSISCGDAVGLFCMLNIIKPNKLIEVGSGWSSAMTLDVNQYYLDNSVKLEFLEPYPELLESLLRENDNVKLISKRLQDVDLDFFKKLHSGDILFIDSTHVSKANSDVNYLFFEILPRLESGVYIHLHDIFYPFEYPHEWVKDGMVWNELYLLRSFLQYNNNFEVIFFQNMMEKLYRKDIEKMWPIKGESIHGGSFWMRKK